jgi:aminopeptidase N
MLLKKNFIFLLLLLFSVTFAFSQEGGRACSTTKAQRIKASETNKARAAFPGDETIDATYYHLDLRITPSPQYISGVVTVGFRPLKKLSSCVLDLHQNHKIDSIVLAKKHLAFQHKENKITVNLGEQFSEKDTVFLRIFYQGKPPSTAFGSFEFGTHGTAKSPVVWSLSEPYGTPDWWPCKDNPADKVDSSDVWLTMPSSFVSVSNGKLESITENAGFKTYKWKNNQPIAHYLISVAATNYTEYTNYYKFSATDSMAVNHFIYPENFTSSVKRELDETVPMLQFFSEKFGQYPFINQKYGHAECGFGGGMEHQTISSMGSFDTDLVAHELAHQWFGNKVTCKTWADIWVNEGFASYSEALYREKIEGKSAYRDVIEFYMQRAKLVTGSVFIQNPTDINAIFGYDRSYAKGAVVLHTLRSIMGDTVFFEALQEYLKTFAFGNATIRDFQAVAERVSEKSLGYFFDDWLFGTGYPAYEFGWRKLGENNVEVTVNQTTKRGTTLFKMFVPLQISFVNGKDSTLLVWVEEASHVWKLPSFSSEISSIRLDPENTILKDVKEININLLANEIMPDEIAVVFPNPTAEYFTIKGIDLTNATLEIQTALGVPLLQPKAEGQTIFIENRISAGKYLLRIKKNMTVKTVSFVVL